MGERELETALGVLDFPADRADVAEVVEEVGQLFLVAQEEGVFECRPHLWTNTNLFFVDAWSADQEKEYYHKNCAYEVKLVTDETAHTDVDENLRAVNSHLKQTAEIFGT